MRRRAELILFGLLVVYVLPLACIAVAVWTNSLTISFAKNIADVWLSGPQFIVGPILIPFVTLFSARRTSTDEVIWTPSAAGLFGTLLALSVLAWFLSAQLKNAETMIIRDLQLSGYDRLYDMVIRYSTETLSYATLVAGVRYQIEPPPEGRPDPAR